MQKMSKRLKQANRIKQNINNFCCPICQQSLQVVNDASITCTNNHSFDIAKQGYVFLLAKPSETNYTKKLFEERRKVHNQSPIYQTFQQTVAQLIDTYVPESNPVIRMIDMGTGEGSHMQRITAYAEQLHKRTITGIGLDISKEGILQAAKHDDEHIWLVADLAHSPVTPASIDVILNVLSPSNNTEFARIIKNDGVILKVIPGQHYLQEVRRFFQSTATSSYSNLAVKTHFSNHFQLIDTKNIQETHTLSKKERYSLAQMSPLAWDASAQFVNTFIEHGPSELTVDLEILIGRLHTNLLHY